MSRAEAGESDPEGDPGGQPTGEARSPRSAPSPGSRWWGGFAAILAFSFVLRTLFVAQALAGPLADLHRLELTAMSFFDAWAKRVASGELLAAEPLHPFHDWHAGIVHQAISERAELAAGHSARTAGRELWNRWLGGARFHQAPLYPYLLGLSYRLFGPSVVPIFLVQSLLGLLSLALVMSITRRAFSQEAALVAGLLGALSGPLVHVDALLLRAASIVFVGLLFTWLLARALEAPGRRRGLALGLCGGVAVLLKLSLALLPLVALVLLGLELRGRRPARAARAAGALLVGLLLALSPALARNLALGLSPLGLSSVGAITFLNANAVDHDPHEGFTISEHAPRIMAETEGRFGAVVVATLRTHGGPGSWLRQLGGKVAVMLHWPERPNNSSYYLARAACPALRYLPLGFGTVGSLGLLGLLGPVGLLGLLVRGRRGRGGGTRWRDLQPLLLLVFTSSLPLLVFLTFGRYRAPLLAALLPFAGAALVAMSRAAFAREGRQLALALPVLLAAALAVAQPWRDPRPLLRAGDVARAVQAHHGPLLSLARARGDAGSELLLLDELISYEKVAGRLGDGGRAPGARRPNTEERRLAAIFAELHELRATARRRAGRAEGAEQDERRGTELRAWSARPEPGAGDRN